MTTVRSSIAIRDGSRHRDPMATASRAKSVVAEFLQDHRPDFWVSDRYGGQLGWGQKDHQVCLAHLIRDAQFAIDAGDAVFAPELRHLLGRACRIGRRRGKLADATLKTYAARPRVRPGGRRAHGARPDTCGRREAAAGDQESASASLRVCHQPRHSPDQQRIGARLAPLRGLSQDHQRLSHRMGRQPPDLSPGATLTFAPSLKPPAAAPSARSTQSVSRSPESRSRQLEG